MAVAMGEMGIPGGTGNISVTGLSFQPVAVLFWNQHEVLGTHSMMFGCSSGSGEEWCVWTGTGTEASGYTGRSHEGRTDCCLNQYTTLAHAWRASMVSMNSDGFTVNFTVRAAATTSIYWMALGGTVTDAHAGTVTAGSSTGTTAVTAPGFQPNGMIFAHVRDGTWGSRPGDMNIGIGVTDGTAQYSSYVHGNQGSAVEGYHIHRTDEIACLYDGTNTFRMALSSFDSSGFTVNVTDAWTGDIVHGYLALSGEAIVAGIGIQPDADGDVEYSTPNLRPAGVFFCWSGVDAPSTTGANTPPLRPGVGGGNVTSNKQSSGIFRNDAPFGVFTSDGYHFNTECLGFWGKGSGIGGDDNLSQASAATSAFGDESFTLTWDVFSPDADRAFGWLALPGETPFRPQFYRVQPGGRIS